MTGLDEIKTEIEQRVAREKGRVLTRNSIDAVFTLVTGGLPLGAGDALRKVFFGGKEALDQEQQRQTQQIILELVCRIDQAMKDAEVASKTASGLSLGGLIEVFGRHGDEVTGVSIDANSGPVNFLPGARITTHTENTRKTTGLRIGGLPEEPK